MDQPDDIEATCASASVFVCHGLGRVQAAPSDTTLSRRVGRSLSGPDHRVSADGSCPSAFVVVLRLRTLWSWKRKLCRARRLVHTVIVLCYCWNVGRILRQHARADRSLPLPNISFTVFEISFDYKIRGHVCPVNHALPNTPLDMGPDNHRLPLLRYLALEGNKPFHPPEFNDRNHQRRDRLGRLEEQYLCNPNGSGRFGNKSAHYRDRK